MADDESTNTGADDSTDTSTNEDGQDTDGDLEDIEVNLEEIAGADETEDTDDSEQKENDPDTKPDEAEEESEVDEEEDAKSDSDEDSKEDDTPSKEEQKRANNVENARKRIAERQQREDAKNNAQQEYLDEADDDKDLALRQLQVDAYNNKIESNANKLQNGIDRSLANIDIFQNGTTEEKEELARRLEDFEGRYVKYDQNGDPVEVKADVYQYLQKEADSIRRLTSVGARKQAKDKGKVTARTTTAPSRTPKPAAKDPEMDAFDEEANKY